MKESFIVAFLACKDARPEDMVVPKEIEEFREKHGIVSKHLIAEDAHNKGEDLLGDAETAQGTEANEDVEMAHAEKSNAKPAVSSDSKPAADEKKEPEMSTADEMKQATESQEVKEGASAGESKVPEGDALKTEGETKAEETAPDAPAGDTASSPAKDEDEKKEDAAKSEEDAKAAQIAKVREGKFAAMAARKRDLEGKVKGEPNEEDKAEKKPDDKEKEKEVKALTVKDSKGRTVKVLDDDLEEMDCEFLNNRQAFLNLCQGNHYQFDQLRRAKHSSMMVLWHLHNRDAPKFVQQCAICSREILTGYRYHCPTCDDYDQCHDCVSNPKSPRHPHQLKQIPVASGQQSEMTEAQRKERQRSIQLHMTLLQHAATCKLAKCSYQYCTRMSRLFKHGASCQVKTTGGCHVCKTIWALLQLHARQCTAPTCPVPNCRVIRERQLKKQQQAMDDRRRQKMNRHSGGAHGCLSHQL
jgi:E1A/CREB-binding protein